MLNQIRPAKNMLTKKIFLTIALVIAMNLAFALSAAAEEETLDFDTMKKIYEERKERAVDTNQGNGMMSGVNEVLKGGMMISGPEYSSWEEDFIARSAGEKAEAVEEDEFLTAVKNKFQEHQLYFKIIKINNLIKNALSSMQN